MCHFNILNGEYIARESCGTQSELLPLLPSGPDGVHSLIVAQGLAKSY